MKFGQLDFIQKKKLKDELMKDIFASICMSRIRVKS